MLGVAKAALFGAAFAQQGPVLVSLWAFDETSDAGGVFNDLGPASLAMDIVGTWADLSTDSMVQGIGGTSAYTGGSGYATTPANHPAHELPALTISFYYQPNSAAAKHILFAAGNGTQAGDFSIELLANGRLRAYHVGQDNVLRFFESTNGVTGTNLQVGTAYRIDLTLGSLGARIYLDGVPLTDAFILANTNGWNNSPIKYLGVFTDGVSSPADGAFDRFRIWDRQLSNEQIAVLEPAQSITLPVGQAELTVPSLAEWLISDESDPLPTKYVSDQNRGDGSGSSPANAQAVQTALSGAAPGDTFLAVCQTPGTIEFWDYPNGLTFPSGSSNNYVTLQARQGDGVVVSAGEDFAGARTPKGGFWTQSGLSADDIDKNIWRSASTFPGGEQAMMGMWIEFDHPHQLLRYSSLSNLRAPYGQADGPTNYATPGVHKGSDGHVYIRMQKPHPVKYSRDDKWSETLWYGYPEAVSDGQLDYPKSQDPNDYVMHLWRVSTSAAAFSFSTAGWAKVGAGINSMGHRWTLNRNSHDIWCDRGLHYNWQSFIRASITGETVTNYVMNRMRCTDGSKIHAAISEWKFGGWLSGIRSSWFTMFNSSTASGIYCKDCTIGDYHDVITGAAHLNSVRFRNCTFHSTLDDGFQTRYSMSRVEVGYCYYYNSDWGGFGESGDDGQDADPGQWYFHHNILDCRREKCSNWRAQPHPQDVYTPHSPDGNSPRKFYNNLVFSGPDIQEEDGIGFQHQPQADSGGNNTLSGAAMTHQMFNNIILKVFIEGTKRYDPVVTNPDAQYSDIFQNRSDFLGNRQNRYSAAATNELQDYNLYWRRSEMTVDGAFRNQRGGGQTVTEYPDLAAWFASSEFDHSKLSGTLRGAYAAGWEGNSTMTKPTLPALDNWPAERFQYRPAATSSVTTAASGSLNGQNWWTSPPTWGDDYFPWNDGEMTLAPSAYKGPLDPSGDTIPVGVQNP
jgi:hypothetical protein